MDRSELYRVDALTQITVKQILAFMSHYMHIETKEEEIQRVKLQEEQNNTNNNNNKNNNKNNKQKGGKNNSKNNTPTLSSTSTPTTSPYVQYISHRQLYGGLANSNYCIETTNGPF